MSDHLFFKQSFVEFDQQGEPHPQGELDGGVVKTKLLPVLYRESLDDKDEWLGPVFYRDDRNNLQQYTSKQIHQMHVNSYKTCRPCATTERLSSENREEWFFYNTHRENSRHEPVPSVKVDGKKICLREIPFQ